MDQEIKYKEQMEEGNRASIALSELKGAVEALEEQCFATFKNAEFHDDDGRRACTYYLRVLRDVEARLNRSVLTGVNAHKKLMKLKPSFLRKVANV